eukprot:813679-Rhodomonas_salina.1
MGAILGMPWLQRNRVKIDHADKTARFAHCNCDVVLLPSNPVFPAPLLEPIKALPPWHTECPQASMAATSLAATPSTGNGYDASPGPHSLTKVLRETHLPSPQDSKQMVRELHSSMSTGRDEYEELLADMRVQGIKPPPSAKSLSSMKVFKLVELNTAHHFERAVLQMTDEEQLDCGALFFRGDTDSLKLSDLPFSSPLCSADECALSH